jgi:hypothetical protein
MSSRSLSRYLPGIALALSAVGIQLAMRALLGSGSYQLLLGAVALSAIRWGKRNGVVALGVSVVSKWGLFALSYSGREQSGIFMGRMIMFILVGAALCSIGGGLFESEHRVNRLLERAKLLSGLLPICACCKRIRDDRGRWCEVESYVGAHSDAVFSHGYCPRCAAREMTEAGVQQ